ncbi:NAD-dependent epimerase/dehydratase family protein [Tichowtungia aerotolerans]|uniref:NAD-dependent epimerase/dehydratase family protein n=1 Tax=Tichowtungia aerotolerans TaxID=2697043 RepID=A0A6P1MAP4_9BACT|nr:NAD-dependent epimerase/dehydratase family protein [Tichowtungia aerotolerans]QHI70173.1 NAD-dependent epimerase/dehydratase family protein [Tichowtungia aerotolerans]
MKILVTGAAGFIGSYAAHSLLDDGHEVVGLDNFNDYYDVSLKEARFQGLEKRSGFTMVRGDLADYELLRTLFEKYRFDRVCHLAAQAGVRYSIQNPFAYQQSNLQGHLNILEACRHAEVSRLVYASSSSVYGGSKKIPFSEEDPVDHPVSLYAATKKANELMSHTYTHLYGLQTVGLRFFTVYGPWGRPDMAYWLFTDAMLKGQAIQVFNHGKMERDFTYIDDIVAGVKASLAADGLEPYEIFNLGNNTPENLMEFIQTIAGALGVEPKMEMLPMQAGDVPTTFADVSKARKKLGYDPSTPISAGIPAFVSWYREYFRR